MAFALAPTGPAKPTRGLAGRGVSVFSSVVHFVASAVFVVFALGTVALGLLSWSSNDGTASVLGHEVLIVRSGSMAPSFAAGDALVIRRVDGADPSTLREGDVVTVRTDGTPAQLVTHRIVGVSGGDGTNPVFTIKGDANPTADATSVTADQVVGIVQHSIPRLGYVMHAMQERRALLMFAMALLLGRLAVGLVRFAENLEAHHHTHLTHNTSGEPQ